MAISNEMGKQNSSRSNSTHRGMAFLVEALVVLAFLMTSLAVFVQLFSSAQIKGLHSERLSRAVILATNTAEEFSAHPTTIEESTTEDGLTIVCDVDDEKRDAGTLYNATITVRDGEEDVYTLHTARYVSTTNGGAR